MTVAESGPVLVPDAQVPEPAQPRRPDAFSVVDTTELRWFVPGPLPADIRGWFTGSTGVAEERCDTYLLDGRGDIGVKRRFRETLELKVRQSLDERIELGEGLAGSLEVWRKWSPAEGLVEDGTDAAVGRRPQVDRQTTVLDGRNRDRLLVGPARDQARDATSRSRGSPSAPSRRGRSRSRRSVRPRPDATRCSRRGRR